MAQNETIEIVNTAEEILLRARFVARRVQERVWKAMQGQPLPKPHAAPPSGLLIADDEAVIRELLELMLHELGFDVWLAADGREAVELYRKHHDAIGAVLLDIHMPRLNGPRALLALRALSPQVRCVFLSGHSGGYDEEELHTLGAPVLQKPFTPDELLNVLRPLLGGSCPAFGGIEK